MASETYEPDPEELESVLGAAPGSVRLNAAGPTDTPAPPFEKKLRRERKGIHEPDPHRMLPANLEAERAVICSCFLDPACVGKAIEMNVTAESFHVPAHATMWRTLLAMWESKAPFDEILFLKTLHDRGLLEEVGGGGAVSQIFTMLPTAANAEYYIEILIEKHTLRELIVVATQYAGSAYEPVEEPLALLDSFEQRVLSIRKFKRQASPTISDLVKSAMDKFQASFDRKGEISGLSTGFAALDIQLDGLQPEQMIVIAARPSHGKTALAMNIAEHVAVVLRKPVGIFSAEMSGQQLTERLILSRARVDYRRWRDGFRTQDDCDRMARASEEIARSPIYIDDTAGISIQEARARARRWKAELKIELVMFDYLQLLKSTTKRAQENRAQEVSEISGGCKGIAKDLGVPAVVLVQLGRDIERTQRRPRLSDLRESGSIEQDADVVGALTRDELFAETEEDRLQASGRATLEILKQRSGPIGPLPLTFYKEFTLFTDRAEQQPEFDEQPTLLETEQQPGPKTPPRRKGYKRTA